MDDPDFSQLYAMWRNEGLTPLSLIQGYAALLLDEGLGPLSDEQRRALEIIQGACGQAINCWYHPTSYLELVSNKKIDFKAISLPEIIEEVLKTLRIYAGIDKVEVILPNNLPLVRSNWDLATAIQNFIMWNYATGERTSTPAIEAKLQDDKVVRIEIQPGYRLTQMRDSDLDYPGTRLYVANAIIQRQGGQVEISSVNQNIHIQFNLYTWEDDISHQ